MACSQPGLGIRKRQKTVLLGEIKLPTHLGKLGCRHHRSRVVGAVELAPDSGAHPLPVRDIALIELLSGYDIHNGAVSMPPGRRDRTTAQVLALCQAVQPGGKIQHVPSVRMC